MLPNIEKKAVRPQLPTQNTTNHLQNTNNYSFHGPQKPNFDTSARMIDMFSTLIRLQEESNRKADNMAKILQSLDSLNKQSIQTTKWIKRIQKRIAIASQKLIPQISEDVNGGTANNLQKRPTKQELPKKQNGQNWLQAGIGIGNTHSLNPFNHINPQNLIDTAHLNLPGQQPNSLPTQQPFSHTQSYAGTYNQNNLPGHYPNQIIQFPPSNLGSLNFGQQIPADLFLNSPPNNNGLYPQTPLRNYREEEQQKRLFPTVNVPMVKQLTTADSDAIIKIPFPQVEFQMTASDIKVPGLKTALANWVGALYSKLSDHYFRQFVEDRIQFWQAKILFSQSLVLNMNDLTKYLRNTNRGFYSRNKTELLAYVSNIQRKVLKFMKSKFPKGRKYFKSVEFEEIVGKINNSEDPRYDIIRNSSHFKKKNFKQGQYDFIREIKRFINELIVTVEQNYASFVTNITGIFTLEGTLNQQEVKFKVSKKIPDNVPLFAPQQLDTKNIKIKCPEILRILIKWLQALETIIQDPKSSIKNRKAFKHRDPAFEQAVPISGTLRKQLIDYLIQQNVSLANNQITSKHLYYSLLDSIMEICSCPASGAEFLDPQQIKTIRMAKLMSLSLPFFIVDRMRKIMTVFKQIQENKKGTVLEFIDLITFDVYDLLRCSCQSNKDNIIKIFKQIQKSPYLEIIRIKNRLDTPLNDIMVNCKIRDSILICQIQLSVSSAEQTSRGLACSKFNHFLYELQRSRFGPLAQASIIISDSDPRMQYSIDVKKMKPQLQRLGQLDRMGLAINSKNKLCHLGHQLITFAPGYPFICSLCNNLNKSYSCIFDAYTCFECDLRICPSCLFERMDSRTKLTEFYLKSVKIPAEFFQLQRYYQLRFYPERLPLEDVIAHILKKQGKKYCLLLRFTEGVTPKRSYKLNSNGCVSMAFYSLLGKQVASNFESTLIQKYDVVCFPLQQQIIEMSLQNIKSYKSVSHMSSEYNRQNQSKFRYKCITNDQESRVLVVDTVEDESHIVEDYKSRMVQKIVRQCITDHSTTLDLSSLGVRQMNFVKSRKDELGHVLTVVADENQLHDFEALLHLPSVRKISLFGNKLELPAGEKLVIANPNVVDLFLGKNDYNKFPVLISKQLKRINFESNRIDTVDNLAKHETNTLEQIGLNKNNISQIPAFEMLTLKRLMLTHNKITSLSFLKACKLPLLEALRADNNFITEVPELHQTHLQILSLSANRISKVDSLLEANTPKLYFIDLSSNQLTDLPKISLSDLKILNLSNNKLENLSFLDEKYLKKLKELYLRNNNLKKFQPLELPALTKLDLNENLVERSEYQSSSLAGFENAMLLDVFKQMEHRDGEANTGAQPNSNKPNVIRMARELTD